MRRRPQLDDLRPERNGLPVQIPASVVYFNLYTHSLLRPEDFPKPWFLNSPVIIGFGFAILLRAFSAGDCSPRALQGIFYRIAPNKIFQRNTVPMLYARSILRASNQHSPLI